jgi:diamine N-acetyltransferase
MHQILRVTDYADIELVFNFAHEIWNTHFVSIVGQEQVDYMLVKYQCVSAIRNQMAKASSIAS